jgi:CTP:molybdopterin cytidylyltransferase MocA
MKRSAGGIAGLILAAGAGSRFGGAKLTALLRGRPLVAHVLDVGGRARAAGLLSELRIVIAPGADAVSRLAGQAGAATVVNEAPERGLSSSLRRGLVALPDAGAAVVLLADQPLVRLDIIALLVAAWHERLGVMIRPRYAEAPNEPGHPVLLDRSVWPLADRLEGDAGVGKLLPAGAPGVAVIDVTGRNPDVDVPADLHSLEGSAS